MKQINFPYMASIDSNYQMIHGTITDFNRVTANNSDSVRVLLNVHTVDGEDLIFQFKSEPSVADYYQEMYEQSMPVTMFHASTSYLVYDLGVSNS